MTISWQIPEFQNFRTLNGEENPKRIFRRVTKNHRFLGLSPEQLGELGFRKQCDVANFLLYLTGTLSEETLGYFQKCSPNSSQSGTQLLLMLRMDLPEACHNTFKNNINNHENANNSRSISRNTQHLCAGRLRG